MTEPGFAILAVCTGNICRSPLAQQLLGLEFEQLPARIAVASAGTSALVGRAMTPPARAISRELGGKNAANHVARQLTVEQIRRAYLVLALSREHRRIVVGLEPRAARYTFTIRELAHILESMSAADVAAISLLDAVAGHARLTGLVAAAASLRGHFSRSDTAKYDVVDPYRGSDDTYRLSAKQVLPAAITVGRHLRATVGNASGTQSP